MYTELKTIQEDYINDVLYHERKEFIQSTRGKYPGNKADGYNNRTLSISLDTILNIKVPKCRIGNKELNYSLFEKYSRHTRENLIKIKEIYKERNFKAFVCSVLSSSKLPGNIKNDLKKKYLTMYNNFIGSMKRASEIIKLDATHFGKVNSISRYVMYLVWGLDSLGNKTCLYFHVTEGSETRKGWEDVIKYMIEKIDMSGTQVIVSDLHQSLKLLLKEYLPNMPLQNCMFHRLQSIVDRLDIPSKERKGIFSMYYSNIFNTDSREELEDIFETFKSYDYTIRKDIKMQKTYARKIDRMLGRFYEDNFTFLDLNLDRKLIIQNMDIESTIGDLKNYLRYNKRKSIEILTWKTMMFLDKKDYLDKEYI